MRPDWPINGRTLEQWTHDEGAEVDKYLMGLLKRFLGTEERAKHMEAQYALQKLEDERRAKEKP